MRLELPRTRTLGGLAPWGCRAAPLPPGALLELDSSDEEDMEASPEQLVPEEEEGVIPGCGC